MQVSEGRPFSARKGRNACPEHILLACFRIQRTGKEPVWIMIITTSQGYCENSWQNIWNPLVNFKALGKYYVLSLLWPLKMDLWGCQVTLHLHFLSEEQWGGNSRRPQALGIVHRGPEREAFSQHRDAGECVCTFQIGKALGGGGWWGQGRMVGRSLPLWPVSPRTPFSQEVLPISQLGLISSVLVPHEGSQPLWERNHWGI